MSVFNGASYARVLILFTWFFRHVLAEIDPIVIEGSRFFYKTNGSEFFIRGIQYQSYGVAAAESTQFIDSLADEPICARDIPYLQDLTVNVVQVLYLDPAKDHSGCMNALADAGIYVLTSLESPTIFMDPKYGVWDLALYDHFTGVVDSLVQYDNLLGFTFGGPTLLDGDILYHKAGLRDIKKHIRDSGARDIPLGWIGDSPPDEQLDFLLCEDVKPDFIGIPIWMTDRCTTEDDINDSIKPFSSVQVPVYSVFSGCYLPDPTRDDRNFSYIPTIYADNVTEILNGAVLGDFYQDLRNDVNFGLVALSNIGDDIIPLEGYSALSSVLATVSPSSTKMADFTPTAIPPSCPTGSSFNVNYTLPPTPNKPLCSCMMNTLRCTVKDGDMIESNTTAMIDAITAACEGELNTNCVGIYKNSSTGTYGAFSSCNSTEMYAWAANKYWERHGEGSCDLNGTAKLLSERQPPSSSCVFLLNQAGKNGESTVTAFLAPTATAAGTRSSKQPKSGSLSVGQKAGIGVGVSAFAILAFLGALFFLHRKKQERKHLLKPGQPDLPEFVASSSDEHKDRTSMLPEGQALMRGVSSPRQ